jgi:hypothetical protein
MSQLQKRIQRLQRRDGPAIGFGRISREQPRAMALIATANDSAAVKAALEVEVDAVIVEAGNAADAARAMDGTATEKIAVGALLPSLSEEDVAALRAAKCDFVISPLETTDSAAVDTEKNGQVVMASLEMEDNTLRVLGPLGLDGLFVKRAGGAMTLGQQLGLVRLATFASTGLIVTVDANSTVGELRVLRDSGTLAVVAPAGTSADGLKALSDALKAVPAPKRGRREGGDIAIVPSSAAAGEEHEHDDDDEDD